ncbi:family 43 glycosylhydrolase [Chitinophaga polysaccharea]|uniref:glycoside hydrolase family 43 protein n=1 Tax=Chitinophaga TaxID=79328 RepID=UPI001454FFF3|nr:MULTISPECIES: glycoside hydrolase family 43 protein [Chitinophaga]NLR61440.1 family 43 glycosylhydrolase [Chitinophaga polysaccharea]NLU95276.1 family 43 glycosylhydrolase [Chitinophaga sp. Ak27]
MKVCQLLSLLCLLLLAGVCRASTADTAGVFTNPLLGSGPDPWVIQHKGYYYYLHTTGHNLVIRKTARMSELGRAPEMVVWTPPRKGPNVRDVWAPELHRLDNKWYLYYTAGSSDSIHPQHTFVLENTAEDPTTGTWTDRGQIKDTAADYFAIDGTVFTYQRQRYFIWSGHNGKDNVQRLYIARMSNPWTLVSPRVEIAAPKYAWEQNGVNEGPEILRNNRGDVFLVFSACGCWTENYTLGIMTLKKNADPLQPGNWTKSAEPVLKSKPENGAFAPGHNGFFKSVDGREDWIIYHANSKAGQGCGGARNPRIQQISWRPDGRPDFGEPVKINTPLKRPSGE